MSRWVRAADAADIPPGEGRELVVEDRMVALFNIEGEFHALDGVCPHQGGPIGRGRLEGCVVTCPWHGWQYDVTSGQHQSIPALRQPGFPTKVEDGAVLIDLEPEP